MRVARQLLKGLALSLVALGLSILPAIAGAKLPVSSLSPLGPETSVPFGWVDFCQRYGAECDEKANAANLANVAQTIELTPATLRKIEGVNALVNSKIEPVSDLEHAGVPDAWDFPADGKGDCEDYALLKRRVLIEAGFPRAALLLAVVKDEHNDGHAVLMARTDHGDFVLDNLADEVKPWNKVHYRFVKRQSQENQNVWVAVGAPTSAPMYVA
jgi:predicted transglutaminase-like cysteine proteinase